MFAEKEPDASLHTPTSLLQKVAGILAHSSQAFLLTLCMTATPIP